VQLHRIEYAERFAKENSCIVVLKGAGTIVTDGDIIHINTAGSSALAKAGSGDVLAGFMASFLAQKKVPSLCGAAISVYFHAVAGDNLAEEFSSYGVTPSDLPMEIARQIAKFER
jgi:NAD(P)H-hydrate epimerase